MTGDPAESGQVWPTEKLSALRLGRRLVAEIPATTVGLRAFVDITPLPTPEDAGAAREGWTRADQQRTYRVQHWEYRADLVDGYDYDVDSALIREATVTGEPKLATLLEAWKLRTDQFRYPRQTDDPR